MRVYNDVEVTEKIARLRNLLISITKGILKNGFILTQEYTIEEIEQYFYFRKKDITYYLCDFFIQNDNKYILVNEKQLIIKGIIEKHNKSINQLDNAKIVFIKTFGRFYEKAEHSKNSSFDYGLLNKIYPEISAVIPILHWGLLPLISKYLMINSGKVPEDDVEDFYYHYHMLSALLEEVKGRGIVMSMEGDVNLEKEMNFSVYTRRWGHNDTYRIMRTIDGWNVNHISINGKCNKAGEGALMGNLHHDSIFFPEEAVKYAFCNLWEEADECCMTVEELQIKIQQIADWISSVEKVVGESQPEWVGYY